MRFLLLDDQRSARLVLKHILEDRPDVAKAVGKLEEIVRSSLT